MPLEGNRDDKSAKDTNGGRESILQIDVQNETYEKLCGFAQRISNLLESEKVVSRPDMVAALDDLLGAVYAMIFARHYNFEDRSDRPIEVKVVLTRAQQVAQGKVRNDGKWMAGFYFNSALFRMSAVYHRVLKLVTGKSGEVGVLRPEAENLHEQWNSAAWQNQNVKEIHGQATDLKHGRRGIYEGRRKNAGFENALLGVGELLDLIEAWSGKI
jgi:hypothetical protein